MPEPKVLAEPTNPPTATTVATSAAPMNCLCRRATCDSPAIVSLSPECVFRTDLPGCLRGRSCHVALDTHGDSRRGPPIRTWSPRGHAERGLRLLEKRRDSVTRPTGQWTSLPITTLVHVGFARCLVRPEHGPILTQMHVSSQNLDAVPEMMSELNFSPFSHMQGLRLFRTAT